LNLSLKLYKYPWKIKAEGQQGGEKKEGGR